MQRICLYPLLLKYSTFRVHFTVLDEDMIWSIFVQFNQFSVAIDSPKQLTLENILYTTYLHSEHYRPENETRKNFQNNRISV